MPEEERELSPKRSSSSLTMRRGHKKDKVKPQTKIIMRHLPPTMTEEEFLEQIDPLPENDFYYFCPADWSLGFDATCRAYLTLKNVDDVFIFRDRFDGYVFVDSKGAEYPAIVEYAPFQGLAKNKWRGSDSKANTIEEESHYQQFLEKLDREREEAAKAGDVKIDFTFERKADEKITSTPLLQYLAGKKEKRREDAKKRNDEKRRQREEERRQSLQLQQLTEIAERSKSDEIKVEAKSNNGTQHTNDGNNSRSRRRAERDHRRREEHNRKKALARQEREQRAKSNWTDSKNSNTNLAAEVSSSEKLDKSKNGSHDAAARNESATQRADGKRTNSWRDRDRNRNRDKDKARKENATTAPVTILKADSQNEKSTKPPPTSVTLLEEDINVRCKNAICTATDSNEMLTSIKEQPKETRRGSIEMKSVAETTIGKAREPKDTSSRAKQKLQSQRSAEERRIRNKDRPSIAIYQPKHRLRASEESDSTITPKEVLRSNPPSDCESVRKGEMHEKEKRVKRYSERRADRRAKTKSNENINEPKHVLRKSKSSEDDRS